MASMRFDDEAAERLEAVYRGPDIVAQREHTLELLALKPGEQVLDIGSGPGFLCQTMAEIVGPTGRVHGVDLSPDFVRRATARNACPWLSYAEADAVALPARDQSFDVVVSVQVAEYVPDVAHSAPRRSASPPGGRGLVLATDWQALAWHSDDPDRMRRVLDAICAALRRQRAAANLGATTAPRPAST